VEIDLSSATPELFAMLHVDRGVVGEYEFPGDDVPARAGEVMVNVPFAVTLPALEPSVTASDQRAVNGMVVIDQVVAAAAGWIVIHIDVDGGPGPVIGFAPVAAGSNPSVAVEIDLAQATPVLHAMLHLDAGQLGIYEFPGDDVPVRSGEAIVMVPFQLLEPEAAAGSEVAVTVVDGAFREREISVPVGTTVVWTVSASLPHTITADDGSFRSGTLQRGSNFRFTFTTPGTFPYHCEFHGGMGGSGMAGVVTVTP
jgi:plastocyanin